MAISKLQRNRGETVVVTGASAGLGRAIACEFAKPGVRIALLARGEAGLAAAKRDVEAAGAEALALPIDVADAEAVERAAETVEEKLGPIDIWVNNAMASVFSPVMQMKSEEYKRVTDVTYLGTVYGTLAALKRMLPRDCGSIVQVGSALAYRSIPLQSAYCAAKHAIVGFTDSLRCELIHDQSHLRLTVVHMPALNTPQFGWVKSRLTHKAQPVPPIYEPEVGARAVVWAAHHQRREVFVGGSTVEAIEGNKLIPGLLDKYLGHKGYSAQQTAALEDPDRPDNLWNPVDSNADYGARGAFDTRARTFSYPSWLDLGSLWLVGLGLAGFGVAAALISGSVSGKGGMKQRLRHLLSAA